MQRRQERIPVLADLGALAELNVLGLVFVKCGALGIDLLHLVLQVVEVLELLGLAVVDFNQTCTSIKSETNSSHYKEKSS